MTHDTKMQFMNFSYQLKIDRATFLVAYITAKWFTSLLEEQMFIIFAF